MKKTDKVQNIEVKNNNLFLDGYQFHIHEGNMLRCSEHRSSKCKVRVRKIDNNNYEYTRGDKSSHTHPVNKKVYDKSVIYDELKTMVLTGVDSKVYGGTAAQILEGKGDDNLLERKTCVNFMSKIKRTQREKMDV